MIVGVLVLLGMLGYLVQALGGDWGAAMLALVGLPPFGLFISEVMSNVAQVIVFAPVITGMAIALNIDPVQLGVAMTLGASCAGMLPMGTPPNAIVFASGRLKLKHMLTAGFIMNIVSAVLITLFCWYLYPVMIEVIRR